jgi:hypothetical protein
MPRPVHRAPQNRGRTLDGGRNARERRPENIFVFDLWSEEVQARVRRDLHAPVTIAASPSLGDVASRVFQEPLWNNVGITADGVRRPALMRAPAAGPARRGGR